MNKQNIDRNLTYSALLCVLCLALGLVCLWLSLLELAAIMAILALFEGLIFGIWFRRKKRAEKKGTESIFDKKQKQ